MQLPILIIEDDADDQDVIKMLCEDLGICDKLKFFENGVEALEFLRDEHSKPFLILCDINMPKLDGLQLRRIVYEDPVLRKKSIPFIFFSTAATDAQVAAAYDMTVQGFFVKETSFQKTQDVLKLIFEYWRACKHPK